STGTMQRPSSGGARGSVTETARVLSPRSPTATARNEDATLDSESLDTVTLQDIRTEINPDMDGEVTSNSGSEHSDHDTYATFGEEDENDEQNAIGQRESLGLDTATMSPINSPHGDGYSIFDAVPPPSGEPILRDRPGDGYSMPSATSGGFPARDTASGGLLISSVTGGGLTPAVALWKSPLRSDDFLSAHGGETCVRQGTTDFGATLTPSISSTNLLSD